MKQIMITENEKETRDFGERLARKIIKMKPLRGAVVIGLEGDLGGGKTTFLQGFAKGLGIKQKILSPTFVIMRRFQVSSLKFQDFYHIDCYRIRKPKEILDLGFKEIISHPQNIVAVEWADRVKKIIPKNSIWIDFEFIDNKARKILLK